MERKVHPLRTCNVYLHIPVRHYRNCRRAICLKFGCRVLRDPHQ
ncbi:hypothetical protein ALC57_01368 [Trachymyrmex cornetzi]|uniref:Uncharacterized protein n=1 Tax=Trachymyrmex cornetzi TaxID=471704 RepID=A0A195ELU0_9HYME|nr:hypothetical protein ALC57_01368 [Trachymyrmex cornetzi]